MTFAFFGSVTTRARHLAVGVTAAFLAAAGLSVPSQAALLHYSITGQGKFVDWGPTIDFSASFEIDTTTLFTEYSDDMLMGRGYAATLAMSPFYASGPGVIDEIHFWGESSGGGLDLAFTSDVFSGQGMNPTGLNFYTGPTDAPVFQVGSWTGLTDYFLQGWSYDVTVTEVEPLPQPVPEPAALSIMALGVALLGRPLRRRS